MIPRREQPGNIDMWLDYIEFQDIAFGDSDFEPRNDNEDGTEKKKKKSKGLSLYHQSFLFLWLKLEPLKRSLLMIGGRLRDSGVIVE